MHISLISHSTNPPLEGHIMTTIPSNIITNSETTESAAKIAVSAPLAATTDTCVADKTASPTPASPKSKEQLWYVMTHLEPKMMEQRLQEENTSRVAGRKEIKGYMGAFYKSV